MSIHPAPLHLNPLCCHPGHKLPMGGCLALMGRGLPRDGLGMGAAWCSGARAGAGATPLPMPTPAVWGLHFNKNSCHRTGVLSMEKVGMELNTPHSSPLAGREEPRHLGSHPQNPGILSPFPAPLLPPQLLRLGAPPPQPGAQRLLWLPETPVLAGGSSARGVWPGLLGSVVGTRRVPQRQATVGLPPPSPTPSPSAPGVWELIGHLPDMGGGSQAMLRRGYQTRPEP